VDISAGTYTKGFPTELPAPSSSLIATPASSAARIKACRTVSAGIRPASQARQKSIALCWWAPPLTGQSETSA